LSERDYTCEQATGKCTHAEAVQSVSWIETASGPGIPPAAAGVCERPLRLPPSARDGEESRESRRQK
jgi:hypothetical protein